ncbi:MAG: hypothetical protein MUF24_01500 [Chitinophagaceae bacterium]|jgi:hypothetical protein|nr:hypothetical protein [Chitinophagaceae bacterium]
MASFGDLQPDFYYVVQEQEGAMLELVYVPLVTEKCVLVEYQDEEQRLVWYRKTDTLSEIVEQLTDEQAEIYESLFDDDNDLMNSLWADDDEEDEIWEELEEDDDDDDDDDDIIRNIASKN